MGRLPAGDQPRICSRSRTDLASPAGGCATAGTPGSVPEGVLLLTLLGRGSDQTAIPAGSIGPEAQDLDRQVAVTNPVHDLLDLLPATIGRLVVADDRDDLRLMQVAGEE